MTRRTCPRTFEVEAARDGRLGGAARKNLQRHVEGCAACAAESDALDRLAQRARAEADGEDDLRFWRERNRLLAAFDGALLSPKRPAPDRRAARWLLAAAAIAAAVVALRGARPFGEPRPRALASIQADGGTAWRRRPGADDREEIALRHGTLWIHVDRAAGERPVRVLLPDGELEDRGTTFTVSADATATTRVIVQEGRVVLRLRGRAPVELGAGERWPSSAPAVARLAGAARAVSAPLPPDEHRAAPARVARSTRPMLEPTPAAAADPLAAFRAAAAALRAGDNAGAAMAFTRFLTDHPDDLMAEDAAYLRVIAFQRMGAGADLRRAARAYLQRFPAGFRREEVSRLTD
ncbi:MAG TPA: FecR domain-containing protein [Polyangia bacterium]|nr:FecR domain-containing protein [Polyangia bacterium]